MEGNLAILFVDICDSSRLYESVGNARAAEIIQVTLDKLFHATSLYCGRRIRNLGDGLLCVFQRAEQAALAADAMRESCRPPQGSHDTRNEIRLRIALHYGNVVDNGDEVFGDAVNISVRVEGLASPGEILLTEEVASRLPEYLLERCQFVDILAVKGTLFLVRVYRLRRSQGGEISVDSTIETQSFIDKAKIGNQTLTLKYGDRKFVIGPGTPRMSIGRGTDCDIAVDSPWISRQHGTIEAIRDSFLLTDHSSNGTYIRFGSSFPIVLLHDSTRLIGNGLIGFGAAPEAHTDKHLVRFFCDDVS